MTKSDLRKKTPKQLMTALKNLGWSKGTIIDLLDDVHVGTSHYLNEMTYLELCERYGEDIIECVWECYESI